MKKYGLLIVCMFVISTRLGAAAGPRMHEVTQALIDNKFDLAVTLATQIEQKDGIPGLNRLLEIIADELGARESKTTSSFFDWLSAKIKEGSSTQLAHDYQSLFAALVAAALRGQTGEIGGFVDEIERIDGLKGLQKLYADLEQYVFDPHLNAEREGISERIKELSLARQRHETPKPPVITRPEMPKGPVGPEPVVTPEMKRKGAEMMHAFSGQVSEALKEYGMQGMLYGDNLLIPGLKLRGRPGIKMQGPNDPTIVRWGGRILL